MCLCVALVEYKNISGKTLQQSIEGEMSGDLEELLVAIGRLQCLLMSFYLCINAVFNHIVVHNFLTPPVKCVKSVPAYFAERLYECMKVNILFLLHMFAADHCTHTDRNKQYLVHCIIVVLPEESTAHDMKLFGRENFKI